MKPSELRIGNYIANFLHGIGKVESISGLNLLYDRNYNAMDIDEFEPIPIIEEWLLKMGFEKTWFGYEDENIEIEQTENKDFLLSINHNEYTQGEPFKYLHQLQNLYFALTGEELTIKEKPLTNSEGLSN